jgi:hypothetical protein
MAPGGTTVAAPAPKYRQPSPSPVMSPVHAVVEPRLPAVGAAGGEVRPALPQLVVPVETVKARFSVVVVDVLVLVLVLVL